MLFTYTAVVDPDRVRGSFRTEITSAAELAGASEIGFHDDEDGKPAVSFAVEASSQHNALVFGHEVMRSVIGGKLAEGVVLTGRPRPEAV